MRYQLLGALRIADPAPRTITAPKVETLFATLLIRANHTVTTDELIAELWGENPPRHARTALHVYVSQIRKQIPSPRPGAAVLHTKPQGYQMEVDENLVDAVELQRMHTLGRSLLETNPEAALVPLRRAVGLFRSPVLAGIRNGLVVGNFAEWAEDSLARTVLRGEADLRTAATHSWHGRALGDAFTASLTERATIPADQRAEWERQAQLLRDAGAALTVEPMPPDGAAGDGREERR